MNEIALLQSIEFNKTRATKPQIQEGLRALVLDGHLVPGTKLPSTQELAVLWETHVPTVHSALRDLTREGLLSRSHRTGTFVKERQDKLTHVGLYYAENLLSNPELPVQVMVHGAIHNEVKRLLAEMGVETSVWVDSRSSSAQSGAWQDLLRGAERGEIQAVIASSVDEWHLDWIRNLPIATACGSSHHRTNTVTDDGEQFWELSLGALAEQGCRSFGAIAWTFDNRPGDMAKALEVAGRLGLELRDEWMLIPGTGAPWGDVPTTRVGYNKFLELWSCPERPDGLVVFPDALSSGVVLGLLDQQVRVPEVLKVVMHTDEDIDIVCPLPVTFVASSARRKAAALVQQILRQMQGDPCSTIVLPYVRTFNEGRRNQDNGGCA